MHKSWGILAFGVAVGLLTACGQGTPVGTGSGGTGGLHAGPPCLTPPRRAVIIGDSYAQWASHNFAGDLQRETGIGFQVYANNGNAVMVQGAGVLGTGRPIPLLFQDALAQGGNNIVAVVLTGGANDVLYCNDRAYPGCQDCENSIVADDIPVCRRVVDDTAAAFRQLLETMASAGVKDVVNYYYPTVPNGTPIGGANPNVINDYARPLAEASCRGAYAQTLGRLRCTFVDLRPVFQGHPEYFALNDVNPSPSGGAAMAREVAAAMRTSCIAQPPAAACCAR
jgi:hypothetical protein